MRCAKGTRCGWVYHAVDWTESWIRCVLAMEVLTLIAAVALRKSETAQTVLFVVHACSLFGEDPERSGAGATGVPSRSKTTSTRMGSSLARCCRRR